MFLGDTGRMKGQHPGSADSKRRALVIRSVILILLGLGALTLVPYCLLLLLLPSWRGVEEANQKPGTVLLVTAHPDDETVFFAPTITALHSLGHEVFLLCLTTGGHPPRRQGAASLFHKWCAFGSIYQALQDHLQALVC